ncbi:MAG: hypothetical protein GTO22_07580, partial [Gemmatimonadales bacterium]|nr:hypothetical protein [Gemmatimonadales bacterium]
MGDRLLYKPEAKQILLHTATAPNVLYGGAAGGGKLQPVTSQVFTPFGPRPIGDLREGDLVSNPEGTTAFVSAVFPQGKRDIYEVEFVDGAVVECGIDHLWAAWRARNHGRRKRKIPYHVVRTAKLVEWLSQGHKVLMPVGEPVNFTKSYRPDWDVRPIEPYALGALLGDGHLPQAQLCTADPEIAVALDAEFLSQKANNKASTYHVPGVKDSLAQLGLTECRAWDKFIPQPYLYAPVEERWALLRGLMDTDGTVYRDRGRLGYCTTSPQLARDVKFLVESLGGVAIIDEKQAHYSHNGERKAGRLAYNLRIKLPKPKQAFRLERKREICQPPQNMYRRVKEIRPTGRREDCVCIVVDHPNGLYYTDHFVVTHNSEALRWHGILSCLAVPGLQVLLVRREYTELNRT